MPEDEPIRREAALGFLRERGVLLMATGGSAHASSADAIRFLAGSMSEGETILEIRVRDAAQSRLELIA